MKDEREAKMIAHLRDIGQDDAADMIRDLLAQIESMEYEFMDQMEMMDMG